MLSIYLREFIYLTIMYHQLTAKEMSQKRQQCQGAILLQCLASSRDNSEAYCQ